MCTFACACVCLHVKCTLHVSVHIRRRRIRMEGLGEEWGSGIGDESRLLCVVFVDRVSSSVSGEVEWLVPAYHVATAVVATLPIAVFIVPIMGLSHSRAWTRARSSWRLGTPNALLVL